MIYTMSRAFVFERIGKVFSIINETVSKIGQFNTYYDLKERGRLGGVHREMLRNLTIRSWI